MAILKGDIEVGQKLKHVSTSIRNGEIVTVVHGWKHNSGFGREAFQIKWPDGMTAWWYTLDAFSIENAPTDLETKDNSEPRLKEVPLTKENKLVGQRVKCVYDGPSNGKYGIITHIDHDQYTVIFDDGKQSPPWGMNGSFVVVEFTNPEEKLMIGTLAQRRNLVDQMRSALINRGSDELSAKPYVFGGYWRDYYANEDFNDVDIFIPNFNSSGETTGYNSLEYQLQKIRDIGLQVLVIGKSEPYNKTKDVHLKKTRVRIRNNSTGVSVDVDFVSNTSATNKHEDHPYPDLDADVNSLWYNPSEGIIESRGFDKNTAIANIKSKKFISAAGIRQARVDKLIEKGYVHLNPKTDNQGKEMAKETEVKPTFAQMVKDNAGKATYRVAATQMTKAIRAGILMAMKDKGSSSDEIAAVTKLLDSELGFALIQTLLGVSLHYIPLMEGDPRKVKLAEEFQVGGMAVAGNALMDTVTQYLMPAVVAAMSALPPLTEEEQAKLRIETQGQASTQKLRAKEDDLPLELDTPAIEKKASQARS